MLYNLIWQHVSTSGCHFQACNIRYLKGSVYNFTLQFDKIFEISVQNLTQLYKIHCMNFILSPEKDPVRSKCVAKLNDVTCAILFVLTVINLSYHI